ncbi:MAG: class I SAM-dependent methyltransferase [bacterium]|nr:class I SAM-dependent methyltransferase [bacterium]
MSCPVCSSGNFKKEYSISHMTVLRCLKCGLFISTSEHPVSIGTEFSRINEHAYHQAVSLIRQQQAHKIISHIKTQNTQGKKWVDIGCSFGYLLHEAQQKGYDVLGIEPDEKAAVHAKQLIGRDCVYHGVMKQEVIPDNSADIISLLDVLEHIPLENFSEFTRMIHRKLTHRGILVIKVPSSEGLYFMLAHYLMQWKFTHAFMTGVIKRLWQAEYEFPHTVYFNAKTLKHYLENHGFDVETAHYLEEVPNHSILNRIFMDDTIPKWQGFLIAPFFYLVNSIEKLRNKSDTIVSIARCQS